MSLAVRLNQIIREQKISKKDFAAKFGITENYVYLLTGNSKNRPNVISPTLAKLIALQFGYDAEWILHGDKKEN